MFLAEEDGQIEECVITCILCINNILIIILIYTQIPIQAQIQKLKKQKCYNGNSINHICVFP